MDAGFSESSYGFALTYEIVSQNPSAIFAAPQFPSLIQEGQAGGGYDVKLNFGYFLYLQFKLSERMEGVRAGQVTPLGRPYHRFWITPRPRSLQQQLLVDLDNSGEAVFYAAPAFIDEGIFNGHFQNSRIITNSIFVRPNSIGYLTDDDPHCVAFNPGGTSGYFCSEPQKIKLSTGSQLLRHIHQGKQATPKTPRPSIVEVATKLRGVLMRREISPPNKPISTPPEALRYVGFISQTYFNCEAIFISPAP